MTGALLCLVSNGKEYYSCVFVHALLQKLLICKLCGAVHVCDSLLQLCYYSIQRKHGTHVRVYSAHEIVSVFYMTKVVTNQGLKSHFFCN